ncbi:MAG: DUF1641 domain-containing protein [Ardenticatenaceae bacterium]|nr:DUF1641 domain-containing protein [Anaerolineales bacterium]MCB8939833.1 DUF1641 domain-containing protein [Ardenticatenaceae bacterium]MCB8975085.1 DUF1641 domain-containing protein [Ardenticatenaceae bacterium]
MDQTISELNQKIDALTEQVAFLAEEARQQKRRRQEWEELQNDLTPVAGELYRLSVEQLNEIESYVQLEDGLRLFKRLMRNTRNLEQMLDQMESLAAMWQDLNPLSQDAFLTVMHRLDEMERKGYFNFARGGMAIMDNVVTSFTQEDVQQLGENIVLILQAVKEMTQPEIMTMMRNTAVIMREEEAPVDVSMFTILKQLNDPAVKRGLSKTLSVLRTVSEN